MNSGLSEGDVVMSSTLFVLTWVMRQQEVSRQLESGPQTCDESLVAPPTRRHAAVRQIHRHDCKHGAEFSYCVNI